MGGCRVNKKSYNGSMTFADGRTLTIKNQKAENERDVIRILVDEYCLKQTIIAIVVVENKIEE